MHRLRIVTSLIGRIRVRRRSCCGARADRRTAHQLRTIPHHPIPFTSAATTSTAAWGAGRPTVPPASLAPQILVSQTQHTKPPTPIPPTPAVFDQRVVQTTTAVGRSIRQANETLIYSASIATWLSPHTDQQRTDRTFVMGRSDEECHHDPETIRPVKHESPLSPIRKMRWHRLMTPAWTPSSATK